MRSKEVEFQETTRPQRRENSRFESGGNTEGSLPNLIRRLPLLRACLARDWVWLGPIES
jgi:hypothetical protein